MEGEESESEGGRRGGEGVGERSVLDGGAGEREDEEEEEEEGGMEV